MANERSTRPASTSSSAVANMQAPSRETGESVSAVRSPAQGVERRSNPGQRPKPPAGGGHSAARSGLLVVRRGQLPRQVGSEGTAQGASGSAQPGRRTGLVEKRCALQVPLAARREAGGGEERPQRRAAGLLPVDARHQERPAAALLDPRRARRA